MCHHRSLEPAQVTGTSSRSHSLAEPRGVGTGCGHAPLQRVGLTIWSGFPRAPLPGSSQSEVPTPQAWVPPLCCPHPPRSLRPTEGGAQLPSSGIPRPLETHGRRMFTQDHLKLLSLWITSPQHGIHRDGWVQGAGHGGCTPAALRVPQPSAPQRHTRHSHPGTSPLRALHTLFLHPSLLNKEVRLRMPRCVVSGGGPPQQDCVCGHRWHLPGRTHGGRISPCSVEEPRVPGPDRLTWLLRVAYMLQ